MTARALLHDTRAASAAEFALVLPLLLLMLFGIIDAGRYAWEYNRAEKAAQVGARVAVVTDTAPSGLKSLDFVNQSVNGVTLTQGDVIPAGALGDIKCTSAGGCTCATTPCPAIGTANANLFTTSLFMQRMQALKPDLTASNVELHFAGSSLGFAGDPNGMQIAPIVTVKLTGLQFRPIALLTLASFPFSVQASLTAEDESGTQSN